MVATTPPTSGFLEGGGERGGRGQRPVGTLGGCMFEPRETKEKPKEAPGLR